MAVLIGRNTRVEVETSLDTAKTITAITKANPGVATSTAHGFTNGDIIVFDDNLAGMVELAGQIVRVANITSNTFELEGVDTSLYGTFTSGTCREILTFTTLGEARTLTAGGTTPPRLDTTTLLDSEKQFVFGQSDTPELTVEAISNPLGTAMLIVEAAARSNTAKGFKVTMSDSSKRLFRGYISLPAESVPLGDVVTANFSITQIKRRLAYAT